MTTQMEIATHLDLSVRRVRQLIEQKIFPRGASLDEVRVAYIRHLREVAAGRGSKDGVIDLAAERGLLARQQTERVALLNAVSRGEYVSIEEVGRQIELEYSVVRERLLTIPGKMSDALAMRARAEVESALSAEISAALDELSAPAEVARLAAEKEKRA